MDYIVRKNKYAYSVHYILHRYNVGKGCCKPYYTVLCYSMLYYCVTSLQMFTNKLEKSQ